MRIVIWILAIWVLGLGGYLLYEEYWPGATGKLVVIADLPDAQVWVDLRPTGTYATGAPIAVVRGKHSVIVKYAELQASPFVQIVKTYPGRTDTVRFILKKPVEASNETVTASVEEEASSQVLPVPPAQTSIKERLKEEMPWDVPRAAPRSVDSVTARVNERATEAAMDSMNAQSAAESPTALRDEKISGAVEISSSVPGATIFINDRPQDKKTPATLSLEGGIYEIRAVLEGYKSSPEEQVVRISRAASSQFIFFTLVEVQKARREITIKTDPIAGEIYIDSVLVGSGSAVVPHEFGVFNIMFGDVEGYMTPDPVRLTVTPSNPNPEVKGVYTKALQFTTYCSAENSATTEGTISYEAGIYDKNDGPKVSSTYGPHIKGIPGTQKFGWELAMGDPNRNPTGSDYIEFIFTLPNDASPSLPLSLKLYMYRSNKKYPLSLTNRSEITVTVNGRIFLDNYRPHYTTDDAELDRYEEWSLQHTLVPGENRIMIRSGQNNNIFNYLWKIAIE
jgi:hypothetical protein